MARRLIKFNSLCNRRLSTNIVLVVNRGEYERRVEGDEKYVLFGSTERKPRSVCGRIILKWLLQTCNFRLRAGFLRLWLHSSVRRY